MAVTLHYMFNVTLYPTHYIPLCDKQKEQYIDFTTSTQQTVCGVKTIGWCSVYVKWNQLSNGILNLSYYEHLQL